MRRILYVLPLLVAAACNQPVTGPDDRFEARTAPNTELLAREAYSGLAERQRLVIESQSELNALWNAVYQWMSPQPAAPVIDFSSNVVIAAAMGTRGSGGYLIDVKDVIRIGSTLSVIVEERSPASNCGVTAVVTAPVVLVRVARVSEVSFVETTRVHSCD